MITSVVLILIQRSLCTINPCFLIHRVVEVILPNISFLLGHDALNHLQSVYQKRVVELKKHCLYSLQAIGWSPGYIRCRLVNICCYLPTAFFFLINQQWATCITIFTTCGLILSHQPILTNNIGYISMGLNELIREFKSWPCFTYTWSKIR